MPGSLVHYPHCLPLSFASGSFADDTSPYEFVAVFFGVGPTRECMTSPPRAFVSLAGAHFSAITRKGSEVACGASTVHKHRPPDMHISISLSACLVSGRGKAEGIDVGDIKFEDNTDIISLIDSKVSILAILDEEVSVPKATDLTFVNKVTKAFGGHPRYAKPKGANDLFFGVVHFAGQVTYSVKSFLEKNVDKPPEDALDLFQASKNSVLKDWASCGAQARRH